MFFLRPIDERNKKDFHDYCWLFADQLDQSFFPLSDAYELKESRPGFLLYEEDEVIGATCLLLDDSFTIHSKGRFILLHSRRKSAVLYRMLLEAVLPYAEKKGSVKNFLFLPTTDFVEIDILKAIGFEESRKAFFLEKRTITREVFEKPNEAITLKSFKPVEDMAIWCDIINIAYKDIPGHIPYTQTMVKEDIETDSTFPGCARICYLDGMAIGLFYCSLEAEDELWISQLAVLPQYRGRGIGRFLLRTCLNLAAEFKAGCGFTINAENEAGLNLFLSEGFTVRDEYTAFCYYLNDCFKDKRN